MIPSCPECQYCVLLIMPPEISCHHFAECKFLQTGKYDPMMPAYIHAAQPRAPYGETE